MNKLFFLLSSILFLTAAAGNDRPLSFVSETIKPIAVWGNKQKIPLAIPEDRTRQEKLVPGWDGRRRISNVTIPEIYHFPAAGTSPHPAAVIAPGGGYSYLSWEHEGIEIASFLQRNGFSAFLLKYRCPGRRKAAQADAARAIRLIRHRAKEFNIDPRRVGVIGFSAGAHLCAVLSAPAAEPYAPVDEIDKVDYRPDFAALIYPAFLLKDFDRLLLTDEFKIDSKTPPTLLIQTGDDPIKVENSLGWYRALRKAKVDCEMHIWHKGGHGYGLWLKNHPVSDWHIPAIKWFRMVAGMQ